MKINEFVNRVHKLVCLTYDGNVIHLYANQWKLDLNRCFLKLDLRKDNLFEYEDWSECDRLPFNTLHDVLNLVYELRGTPVDERFPKKKYHLRWIDNKDGTCNRLFNIDGCWTIASDNLAPVFTEDELEELKRDNPRFAPVIDAMKEEVTDESIS